jgi:tetratricopeptide (TPR) repeat protein
VGAGVLLAMFSGVQSEVRALWSEDWLQGLGTEFIGACIAVSLLWRYQTAAEAYTSAVPQTASQYELHKKAKKVYLEGHKRDTEEHYDEAIRVLNRAITLAEEAEDWELLAKCYLTMGRSYGGQHKYEHALAQFKRAKSLAIDIDDKNLIKMAQTNIEMAQDLAFGRRR